MSHPTLIEFWRMRRKNRGLPCIVRPFHKLIASKLTKIVMGLNERPNLMILMPPRCAKTDLGTRTFVPWAQSYFPDSEFIVTSYGADLAIESAVDVRNTLSSDWYRSIIDSEWGAHVEMRGERGGGRQDFFKTEEGGVVMGVGRGGAVTGFGAGKLRPEFGGAIIMDDMLKAQEARSAAARKEAISMYTGTLKTRRNRQKYPKTPVILIMQRLHNDDLAGYLLREERDEWDVLQIPAHDEKETIWPGRLDMEELSFMKETQPDDYWPQYMQNPKASSATIFKKEYWRYWNDIKKVNEIIGIKIITADTAFKAEDYNDYNVFQVWGLSTEAMFLLGQVRARAEFPNLVKMASSFWNEHSVRIARSITPASEFWVEDKASGQSLIQVLRTEPYNIPARAWSADESLKSQTTKDSKLATSIMASTDKVARANQTTIPLSSGRVFLPDPKMPGFEWVENFINEHESFTIDDSHLFDDQVDTFTEACLIWKDRGGGTGYPPPTVVRMMNCGGVMEERHFLA